MRFAKIYIPLALICLCCLNAGAKSTIKPHEQTHFSAEDDKVERPTEIPQDAWKILQKDSLVQDTLRYENLPTEQLPRSWFLASSVHLNGPRENDLVVIANPPLAGANITTFWVFLQAPDGMKLVLTEHAHDLIIKSSRSHGHRNISLVGATAVRIISAIYRFDGSQYRQTSLSDKPID
jgi:hypothetical protein